MPALNQYRAEDSYYSFLQRISRSTLSTVVGRAPAPVGFNSANFLPALIFPIAPDQAVKLVSIDLAVSIFNVAGAVIINSMQVIVDSLNGAFTPTSGRAYGPTWANVPLGFTGIGFHVSDEEWLFWNDYTEQGNGGLVPSISVSANMDFNNTGAADQFDFAFTAVVEIYEKQKLGLGGQQATLRTLREIEP